MKKSFILFGLFALIAATPALAQFNPPAKLGYCYYAAGSEWVPISANTGSPVTFNPPAVALYGQSAGQDYALACDANGNIVAGGFPTGASLPATCTSSPVMDVFGLVTGGTTAPYYCSATNTWSVLGGGSGTFVALSGDATSTANGGSTTVKGINNTLLSGLASGLLYNTTATGVPSIATAAQLLAGLGSVAQNSILAGPPSGGAGAATFQTAPTISAANMISFPTFNQNTTGQAGTAVTMSTNGTANQVWSMNSGATAQGWQTVTSGINQLTQDVTASGTGSVAATVVGLNGIAFCAGFSPSNAQVIVLTTVSSPNPCWTAATGAGGSGTVSSGSGYALPSYASAAGTTLGPSNITTDSTKNNLIVPGTASFGSGSFSQILYKGAAIASLPSASGSACGNGSQSCSANGGFNIPVYDAVSPTDCSTGGGAPYTYTHFCNAASGTWLAVANAPLISGTPTNGQIAEWTNAYTIQGVTPTGTGSPVNSISASLVTPALGAATATSVVATGIVDGLAPITLTTGSSATLGGTYSSGYTFNQNASAATAITYTLPTAAVGKQYCVGNSYNGSAATTGTIELLTSGSGQFIIWTDGSESASGGYVISGGAARDNACVVGISTTQWQIYIQSGTWVKH